jgi:hypothetical protein
MANDNYILLERTELNASAASITFSNIPQTGYTDLKIVFSIRTDNNSSNYLSAFITFNGSSTGYSQRMLYGTGSSALSASGSGSYLDWSAYGSTTAATASTFGNGEIYIPNYTGSTNKSVSADSVSETNATNAITALTAGLWSNTAAITSITFTGNSGNLMAGSTFSLYGIAALGTTPVIAPKAYGGNIIDYDGTYWIHTFTTSGTFTPLQGLTCDYLVVAGGGGGFTGITSDQYGGGGGAGGLRSTVTATGGGGSLESAISVVSNTAYAITVGAGGPSGTSGSNSVFSTITSTGGGFGNGISGGSGGGSRSITGTGAGGTASPSGQGFAGGTGTLIAGTASAAGGGGGAGAVGVNGNAGSGFGVAGNGGAGVASSITGTSVTRGGGGGGAGGGTDGTGGTGGGGNGNRAGVAGSGTINTGGGGGGAYGVGGGTGTPGVGGSGIVIIRYPAA